MSTNFDNKSDYFKKRMQLIGATEENINLTVSLPEAEFPAPSVIEVPVFVDRGDQFDILYHDIEGEAIAAYNNNKTPGLRFFKQTRYEVPPVDKDGNENKYKFSAGQGTHPFHPPKLVNKFSKREKIITLYLTEGALKAFAASVKLDIDIVGLTSISHYRDKTGEIYKDIQKIIIECEVENVVILHDGDCLNIAESDLLKRRELTRRPLFFYSAAKKISNLIKDIPMPDGRQLPSVFYSHVLSDSKEVEGSPKGLDDLLNAAEESNKIEEVKRDLLELESSGDFFFFMDITKSTSRLHSYFGFKKIEDFYEYHAEEIGEKEFYFFGDHAYYNEKNEEVQVITPRWAVDVIWVGDKFFVERLEPGAVMDRRRLQPREKSTLVLRHGKYFHNYVKYFDGFCNVPNHLNYKKIHEREDRYYYNRYFPFKWKAAKGSFENTLMYVKHIWGENKVKHAVTGKEYLSYEMGLDYLQTLLTNPIMMLPVLVLYSAENTTGKSTLAKYLARLFEDNVIFLSQEDLLSPFNEPYSTKLITVIEETLFDRKKDVEKIKALVTSNQITTNQKNVGQYITDFFGKMIMNSNNRRMVYLTKHDERFWLLEVPKPKKEIIGLLEKMIEEIPAFIHYLRNRKMVTKEESRMHFHPSLLKTDLFYDTVKINEPSDASEIRNGIRDMFINQPDVQEIFMPMKNIKEEFLPAKSTVIWMKEILRDYVEVDLKRDENGTAIHKRGWYFKQEFDYSIGNEKLVQKRWKGNAYVFNRKDFVKQEVVYDNSIPIGEVEDNFEPDQKLNGALTPEVPAEDDMPF